MGRKRVGTLGKGVGGKVVATHSVIASVAKQSRIFPRRQPGLLRRTSAKLLRNFVAGSSQ